MFMLITTPAQSVMYLERLLCYIYQTKFALQHDDMYLVTMDTEFSDVTASLTLSIDVMRKN